MSKSLLKPTFAIFERFRTATNFALVSGVLVVSQFGALALFFFATLQLLPDTSTTLVVVGSALFLVGIYGQLSRLIIYRYAQPSLIRLLSRFAEGDLSLQFLPGWGKSEGQSLWTELNRMNKEFPNLVRQIRASAQTVASGSREIAHGYVDLSRRTDEQSNTLRDVATSVEEISATAKHNADSCRKAEGVICEVGERAEEAARSMQQVTGTMAGIEAATTSLSKPTSWH